MEKRNHQISLAGRNNRKNYHHIPCILHYPDGVTEKLQLHNSFSKTRIWNDAAYKEIPLHTIWL